MIEIDIPSAESLLHLGFASICLLLIYVLVLVKFSFARLREDHINEMEDLSESNKNFLRSLYVEPAYFINTCQFFILFFILMLAMIITPIIRNFAIGLEDILTLDKTVLVFGVDFVVLVLLSMVVLTFGEIIPKALGLSFPERYIKFSAKIIMFFGRLMYPFIWVAQKVGSLLLEPFEVPFRTEVDLVHNEDEIRMMVNRSHLEGAIDKIEGELIDNVFDFVDRMAKEVMIPRQDVDCLDVEDSFEDNLKFVRATSHTRYPLCVEDKDHIIGLIHIKDLMDREEEARKDLRNIRRDILVIPEVMKLSVLLQYMRTRRIYQAVVVDEYGGMVGLVGLEDIIEELVGDIQDEHEDALPAVQINPDGTFTFDGVVLVDEVEDTLHVEISDADEDTIGGYIFGLLERTPVVGDSIVTNGFEFIVTEVQGYRIARLFVKPVPIINDSINLGEKDKEN